MSGARRLTILLSGMVAGDPYQGGATWAVLQYLLGFRELGHDAYLVEPVRESSLRPAGSALASSENAAYFRSMASEFGVEECSALLLAGTRETVGLPYERLREVARGADVLVNISGMLSDAELTASAPIRVYLDLDPAFNQLWHAVQGIDVGFRDHTHFVTVGRAIGEPGCPVPTCGVSWLTTNQPVVLRHWPVAEGVVHDAFTTVANWRGYGSIELDGVLYGQKAHSLRRFMELPTHAPERLRLALSIHPDERPDLDALRRNGWELLDPAEVAGTPARYGEFVRGSRGELGIAKSGYVLSGCGWFSDRSACYLASGRPVVAQDTGFSRYLPTGEGLFAFTTGEEALAGMAEVRADYARHARAARRVAEEHFDAATVLPSFLARVGA